MQNGFSDAPSAHTLEDLMNFNEAGEIAIVVFTGAAEGGLSVRWSGHMHEAELMTERVCARLVISA